MTEKIRDPGNRWMGRAAAAAYLGVGPSTVDRLVKDGKIHKYSARGMPPRYDRHELDRYVTESGHSE